MRKFATHRPSKLDQADGGGNVAQPRAADDFEGIRARMAAPARLSEGDCAQVQVCRQVLRLAPRGPPRGSDAFLTFLRRLSLLIGRTTRTRLGPAVDRGNRNDLPPSGTRGITECPGSTLFA